MPLPEMDKGTACSFGLEVDGVMIKEISEVSGIKMEQDVIELKQNTADGKYVIKKVPGRMKAPGNITLVRGLTDDNSFEKWVKDAHFGKMGDARKGGAIIVYDFEGNALKRYKMINMWPVSLEISALKAGDTSILTEKLVVTCEQMDPE
ncbi:MAG TPA: phage tail protein [Pilimelia sp.]|nr:phage tail protein [Pilimelia sp.]